MSLYDEIIASLPELTITDEKNEFSSRGSIELRDDGDGIQYVAVWNYSKPIPDGLKLGK
jgi:hypothetical protein